MHFKNCWEFMKCGREPEGAKVGELGICPAASDTVADGLNKGKNGGRICWTITGTFCHGNVQGTYAQKKSSCVFCDFFREALREGKSIGEFVYSNSKR